MTHDEAIAEAKRRWGSDGWAELYHECMHYVYEVGATKYGLKHIYGYSDNWNSPEEWKANFEYAFKDAESGRIPR